MRRFLNDANLKKSISHLAGFFFFFYRSEEKIEEKKKKSLMSSKLRGHELFDELLLDFFQPMLFFV